MTHMTPYDRDDAPGAPTMPMPRVTSRLRRMLAGAAVGALACAPGALAAPAPVPTSESTGVIVEMAPNTTAADRARVARELGATGVRDLGGAGLHLFSTPESYTRREARAELAGMDDVRGVSLNLPVAAARTPNDPCWTNSCALGATGQADMVKVGLGSALNWLFPGAPVTVAVIDTSMALDHPDLAPRLWTNPREVAGNGVDDDANGIVDDIHGADFVNESTDGVAGRDGDPNDVTGAGKHGTHVAGAIGAATDNGIGMAGIAPQARLMSLRFLADTNGGTMADAVSAINYAIDNGAKVINNSWVGWNLVRGTDAVCVALRRALDAGIVVVSAAGNNGRDIDQGVPFGTPIYYPIPATCYDSATTATPTARAANGNGQLTVLATDNDDNLASFSNWSSEGSADMAAPGLATLSTYVSAPGGVRTLGYATLSGTSMASPHVAGAAAMMWAANPGLSATGVRSAITSGAEAITSIQGKSALGTRLSLPGMLSAGNATRDMTPPATGALTAPGAGSLLESTQVEFRWQPANDAASVTYSLWVNGTRRVTDTARTDATLTLPEGQHTWHVVAQDYYGNAATSATGTFTIDLAPPIGAWMMSPMNSAVIPSGTVRLEWVAGWDTSGISRYDVQIDDRALSVPGGVTTLELSDLAVGAHSWSVTAVDGAGRTTTSGPWGFTTVRPATPTPAPSPTPTPTPSPVIPSPVTPILGIDGDDDVDVALNGDARATASRTVRLTVTPPAGAVRMRWATDEDALDRAPWMDITPETSVLLPGSGRPRAEEVEVYVEVADATGASIASGMDDIVLDMAAPRASVATTPSGRWRIRTRDENGPVRVQVKNGRWRTVRGSAITIPAPAAGAVRVRDGLGNTSRWLSPR